MTYDQEYPAFDTPPVRIGIDFDGVLCDIHGYARDHIRDTYTQDFTRGDLYWDSPIPTTDLSLGDVMMDIADDPAVLTDTDPVPGAIDGVRWLAAHPATDPVIITHRPPSIHPDIEDWLTEHGVPDLEFPRNVPENKAEIDSGFDVLIDDYHQHVLDAANAGATGIHFTGSWNTAPVGHYDGVYPVNTWRKLRTVLSMSFADLEK